MGSEWVGPLVLKWWKVAWCGLPWQGMLVRGPEAMGMGSKGVVPLEFSWLMRWIVALLGPTGPGMHILAEQVCTWQWAGSCCAWWQLEWAQHAGQACQEC